jgi:hypothetical protein
LALLMFVLILLLQGVISGVAFVFLVLSGRQTATFIPLRDYQWFVGRRIMVSAQQIDRPSEPASAKV